MKKDDILTLKIDTNEKPIDILELTECLIAIKYLYTDIANKNGCVNFEIKINEVRKGSFEIDFVVGLAATTILPIISNINIMIDFIRNLKFVYNFFNKKDFKIDKNDTDSPSIETTQNFTNLTKPIINYGIINVYSPAAPDENLIIKNEAAKTIAKNAKYYIENKEEDKIETNRIESYLNQSLIFKQTRTDNKKGTKALCKNIYNKEVEVKFGNDFIRKSIIEEDKNPLLATYIVDIDVEFKNKKPIIYKIVALKDMEISEKGLFDE